MIGDNFDAPLTSDDVQECARSLTKATKLANELFGNEAVANAWMHAPSDYFFGLSPFQITMRKEGHLVCELLGRWLGKEDVLDRR